MYDCILIDEAQDCTPGTLIEYGCLIAASSATRPGFNHTGSVLPLPSAFCHNTGTPAIEKRTIKAESCKRRGLVDFVKTKMTKSYNNYVFCKDF